MMMIVRFLLAILLLSAESAAEFSLISYRTGPMVRYLVQSKVWKNNSQRSVLDYGCGGGALARDIASRDKTACVIAVDVNQNVVDDAKLRLKPFPNASAKTLGKIWPFSNVAGSLRGLRWFQKFDIVLSFMGALHEQQETKVNCISVADATKEAVLACRKGGHVIQGEIIEVPVLSVKDSLVIGLLRLFFFPMLSWPQILLYGLLLNRLAFIVELAILIHRGDKLYESRMKQAGLTNITWSIRSFFPHFHPYQLNDDSPSDSPSNKRHGRRGVIAALSCLEDKIVLELTLSLMPLIVSLMRFRIREIRKWSLNLPCLLVIVDGVKE